MASGVPGRPDIVLAIKTPKRAMNEENKGPKAEIQSETQTSFQIARAALHARQAVYTSDTRIFIFPWASIAKLATQIAACF